VDAVGDWVQAILLGILQGLTEFLPISSSAHLRVFPAFLGWEDPGAAFTAVVQIGTELAVLLYFWKDIWRIGSAWLRALVQPDLRGTSDVRLGWFIIVGSIPIVVLGIAFRDAIETTARSLALVGTMLIVFGVILGIADRVGSHRHPIEHLGWRDAVLFGFGQAMALIPGVSRSGATISMGLFLGYERAAATRYAFLLAIPAVVGAGLYQLPEIPGGENVYGVGPTAAATAAAFVVGYATIAWLLRWVTTRSYLPFVVYRVGLGSVVLIGVATGALTA
jgi:undecaprenyl-diphosphatase